MLSHLHFPSSSASHYLYSGDNFATSTSQLHRRLRSEEYSIRNRLKSIETDRRFVEEIVAAYPSLTVHANLRCGLWYLSERVAAKAGEPCYFKSTDGHAHHCKFSDTRLNAHILRSLLDAPSPSTSATSDVSFAPAAPGLLILDSTRKGKRYPDAFTRTIPIWCCVWNRAIEQWRREQQTVTASPPNDSSPSPALTTNAPQTNVSKEVAWDTDLHLPSWVSPMEHSQISQLLPGFVQTLLHSGIDLAPISRGLHKPLRCLWMNTESRGWESGDAEFAQLSFTPILLLQCSVPESSTRGVGQRQGWTYIQGAGDDEENWTKKGGIRGFNPQGLSVLSRELSMLDREEEVVERIRDYLDEIQRKKDFAAGGSAAGAAIAVHHVAAAHVLVIVNNSLPSCASVASHLPSALDPSSPFSLLHLYFDSTRRQKSQIKQKLAVDAERKWAKRHGVEEEDDEVDEVGSSWFSADALDEPASIDLQDWSKDHSLILAISSLSKDRHSLLDVLSPAIEFIEAQLQQGRTTVIVCEDISYASCICTAAVLQQQQQISAASSASSSAAAPSAVAASSSAASSSFDKSSIRATLATVQASLPTHYPSRLLIKQLNQHFMQQHV